MEGRIFLNGKTVSPKSTADAFIFDLQRFDYAWSLNADNVTAEWGENSPIASLTAESSNTWSLTASGTGTVSIDATAGDSDGTYSLVAGSIRSNSDYKIFDASSAALPFYFKLASDNPITSIAGGSAGNSIDASLSEVGVTFVGGASADSFVGGKGNDIFVYNTSGNSDSISGFTAADIVSLGSGVNIPVAASVATSDNNKNLVLGFSEGNSLTFVDGASSTFKVQHVNETFYYSKDVIAKEGYQDISLTAGASSLDATKGNYANKSVSIDASGSTVTKGVEITLNNNNNYFIGSSLGNSITDGTGSDTVSLGNGTDIFYYKGGADSVVGYGAGDSIQLLGKFNPVTDGSKLTSINGGFVLKFDDKNSLTFTNFVNDASSIVSVYGTDGNLYQYTSTAISVAGGEGNKSKVTLGAGFDSATFDGSAFSVISAAAVGSALPQNSTGFSIKGGASASYIVGSDNVLTSISGSESADTLVAGKEGAYFDSITGDDLLIGVNDTEKTDTFIYNSGNVSIENYNYDKDIFSLSSSDLIPPTKIGSDSIKYGSSNYIISLGSDNTKILTFKSANTFALKTGESIYTYTPGTVALNIGGTDKGITLGGEHYSSKTFNGASEANSKFVTIDASAAIKKIKVTGNDLGNYMVASSLGGGTLLGGEKGDTLVAGSVGAYLNGQTDNDLLIGGTNDDGKDTFVYTGGKDSIRNYKDGDIVNFSASDFTLTAASVTAESITTGSENYFNIKLNFDTNNELVFESIAGTAAVSVKSGKTFIFDKVTEERIPFGPAEGAGGAR